MKDDFGVPDERYVVELEYENYFKRMFFVRKKRYAGLMTMYKGQENQSFTEIKGFECMRSDGIEYARQMQRTVIEMIVRQQSRPREIVQFLMDEREKALQGKHKVEDITITKAMTKAMDSYKVISAHVNVAKKIRERGEEVYIGMKVPYVVIGSKPRIDAIPADEFDGTYDATYYWDKLMLPPCYRIVNAVYPGVSWHMLFANEKLQDKSRAQKETNIKEREKKPERVGYDWRAMQREGREEQEEEAPIV
jgi:DNA polymerase elongation subunit (family B)